MSGAYYVIEVYGDNYDLHEASLRSILGRIHPAEATVKSAHVLPADATEINCDFRRASQDLNRRKR